MTGPVPPELAEDLRAAADAMERLAALAGHTRPDVVAWNPLSLRKAADTARAGLSVVKP